MKENALVKSELGTVRNVVRAGDGAPLKHVTKSVPVDMASGDGVQVGGKGAPIMLTRSWALKANRTASLHVVYPSFIDVDGKRHPNPYLERDAKTGRLVRIHVRGGAYGPSPLGTMVLAMSTITLDRSAYEIQDVLSLAKKQKWENGRPVQGSEIKSKMGQDKDALMAEGFYPYMIETDPDLYLGLEMKDPRFLEFITAQKQREKFLERIAVGILERRVLLSHPAIGRVRCTEGEDIKVTGMTNLADPSQMQEIVAALDEGNLKVVGVDAAIEVPQDAIQEAEFEEMHEAEAAIEAPEMVDVPDKDTAPVSASRPTAGKPRGGLV